MTTKIGYDTLLVQQNENNARMEWISYFVIIPLNIFNKSTYFIQSQWTG